MIPRLLRFFLIFFCVIVIAVLVVGNIVMNSLKKTEAFQTAVAHAKSNDRILKETGGVVDIGYIVGGEWNDASADLNFEVYGIKKNLEMYYQLEKLPDGTWTVKDFSFVDN